MPKPPPTTELEFLKLTGNHAEFGQKLTSLRISAPDLADHAKHVCVCWFGLGQQHLDEARAALKAKCVRAAYSRAYYAAYNASKATRYMVNGVVSLKGDDHGKAAANLPVDLPNVAQWSQKITSLYEHRLRADYDNWPSTTSDHTLTPTGAIKIAQAFINEVRVYINSKFGMTI